MMTRLFATLMTVLWIGGAMATGQGDPPSIERALARMVNMHALPLHMIVGEPRERGCRLALDRNFERAAEAEIAAAQTRIFRELELSNVQADIRRFNAARTPAEENLFRVDGETCAPLEYQPQVSDFKPPTRQVPQALSVRYISPPAPGTGIEVEVALLDGKKRFTLPVVRSQIGQGSSSVLELSAPGTQVSIGDEDLILKWGGQVLVDWSLGRWPLLRSATTDKSIRLMVGYGKDSIDVNDARAGARIAFPEGAILTVFKFANGRPQPKAQVSWRQVRTAQVLYSRDAQGQEAWAREPTNFEAQIVNSLRSGPGALQSVTLTMRPELVFLLDEILSRAADDAKIAMPVKRRGRSVYGSVVLMDGLTGEYLGAAGFPKAPAPRRFSSDAFVPVETFREEYLRRRPIGSVAKAPISHAIIATTPVLAGLKLPEYPSGPFKSILGIPLSSELNELGSSNCEGQREAGLACFLGESLNRYAATLVTLAAIPRLDQGSTAEKLKAETPVKPLGPDSFYLVDNSQRTHYTEQPSRLLWRGSPTAEQLMALPWVEYAKTEYRVDIAQPSQSGFSLPAIHDYMWRNAFVRKDFSTRVQMIAPERENLRLDQSRSGLRSDYVQIIIGGGESRWSSAKVAEVFAATVTGNKIDGSFVQAPGQGNWPRLKNADRPDVMAARELYLNGLESLFVTGTGAYWFGPAVAGMQKTAPPGFELKVYAKSGTPTLDHGAPDDNELHPIERAYQGGSLSVVQKSQKLAVYLRGKDFIDGALVASLARKPADIPEPLALEHLAFLRDFNAMEPGRQRLTCMIGNNAFSCSSWPESMRRKSGPGSKSSRSIKGFGKNYVVFAELRNVATGRPCRAVSMAVSFSEEIPGGARSPFGKMMNKLLQPGVGPLSQALGLPATANNGSPRCNARG